MQRAKDSNNCLVFSKMRDWGLIWTLGDCAGSNPNSFRGVGISINGNFLIFKILALSRQIG